MPTMPVPRVVTRYELVTEEKAGGASYTPQDLADFVVTQMLQATDLGKFKGPLRVLDPAVGDGELLISILKQLPSRRSIEVHGFDTKKDALDRTARRVSETFPGVSLDLRVADFLRFVLDMYGDDIAGGLFTRDVAATYDLIIANPPYVRTQVMGAQHAKKLADQFSLSGRVDLYYAFILAMAKVLNPHGTAGIIVSNRFMTTKAGSGVRRAIRDSFNLQHVWDLGDTKIFNAAVLPAVLLVQGRNDKPQRGIGFTSIYETQDAGTYKASTPVAALQKRGVVEISDGRRFCVRQGHLDSAGGLSDVWRITTRESNRWLATVDAHTRRTFGDIGNIRVGVKTCADKVFVRSDWEKLSEDERPELLRTLATHHIARRFKADSGENQRRILYPHQFISGRREAVDLTEYPKAKSYLERHREVLEGRKYVLEAGRNWYEIWVPQDPAAWDRTKLVFRDISESPCFWIDQAGCVVNGDCYWIICDRAQDEELLWMAAAVGNSTFIESFYDQRFNNKLYAGRRRFITQYVEKFPLPDPNTKIGSEIIGLSKAIYKAVGTTEAETVAATLDQMVWKAFGLGVKKIDR